MGKNSTDYLTLDDPNEQSFSEELYRNHLSDFPENFRHLPFEAAVALAGPNASYEEVERHYIRCMEMILRAYTLGFLEGKDEGNSSR